MSNKNRIIELMQIKSKESLNESFEDIVPGEKNLGMISKFISEVENTIGLTDKKPDISISYDPKKAAEIYSFGMFIPFDGTITVVAINRCMADVLRTLAHEMVHFKQHMEGRIGPDSGKDGSDIENEANSEAAIIMRKFGRENPEIFSWVC